MSLVFIDTSVWARISQPSVGYAVADAISGGGVVITVPLMLELLRSARDGAEYAQLRLDYEALSVVGLSDEICARALDVQGRLSRRGYHRGPGPVDLLSAAAAETVKATLWHCDRDFELIAEVTHQPVRRLGR